MIVFDSQPIPDDRAASEALIFMTIQANRREFLAQVVAAGATASVGSAASSAKGTIKENRDDSAIRVLVWDERQPAQKEAYETFLGDRIADHLRSVGGFDVKSVCLDDPERGLSQANLDFCQVLIWWGHVRNREVPIEVGRAIVERIKEGKLSLIALHSAHWSTPFVAAMNERARVDLEKKRHASERKNISIEVVPARLYVAPRRDERITPYIEPRKYPDGGEKWVLHEPNCCFPAYRGDGKPSRLFVVDREHAFASGVPDSFEIAQTEMYDEPFHVPEPDRVIFEERWATGEWFRSGMTWKLGAGSVFYFRPGHETYPVYKDVNVLKIITNAVRAGRIGF
jgi:trehalose utilization protein